MFNWLRRTKPQAAPVEQKPEERKESMGFLSTTGFTTHANKNEMVETIMDLAIPVKFDRLRTTDGKAMDSCIDVSKMNAGYRFTGCGGIPPHMLAWFANQTFIGYPALAVLMQNWLINRACLIPAVDATRNGWDIKGLDEEQIKRLEAFDKARKIKDQVREQARYTRAFGIRISIFKVRHSDPEYYRKPFNIDSVEKGSYLGISQIDQNWCSPQFETNNIADPSSISFYEPDFWDIGGTVYHKSHLVITRYSEVPDILKPSYQFGGLSIPQLIWERVYAAERSANEGPQLLMTKRFNIIKTTLETLASETSTLADKYQALTELRDNYGVFVIGRDDGYEQHETALSDVDTVIMTEYQLVAGVAEMPVTKLLGTTPKGFQSTGEFETQNYHEMLAGVQEHHCSPLLDRHYQLSVRHLFGEDLSVDVAWLPLDEPTEKESADTQLVKAQVRQLNQGMGTVSPEENRDAIMADERSGYNLKGDLNGGTEEDNNADFATALHAAASANPVQQAPATNDQNDAPAQPG